MPDEPVFGSRRVKFVPPWVPPLPPDNLVHRSIYITLTQGGSMQWGIEPGMGRRGRGRGFARMRGARAERLPTIVYREGEPLKDLDKYMTTDGESQLVEVRIAPEYMNPSNKMVKTRQLWGCDTYTAVRHYSVQRTAYLSR